MPNSPLVLVSYAACGHITQAFGRDATKEIERAASGDICPKCRASLTQSEHLARYARAARSAEGIRRGVTQINASRTLKPCDCQRTDGTHKRTCPVYRREATRKHRNRNIGDTGQ